MTTRRNVHSTHTNLRSAEIGNTTYAARIYWQSTRARNQTEVVLMVVVVVVIVQQNTLTFASKIFRISYHSARNNLYIFNPFFVFSNQNDEKP